MLISTELRRKGLWQGFQTSAFPSAGEIRVWKRRVEWNFNRVYMHDMARNRTTAGGKDRQWADFSSPEFCLFAALGRALRAAQPGYVAALRRCDLTPTQFSILSRLAGMGESAISELAGAMGTDRTTLTRTVGPLVARGLVSERAGEGDRRIRLLGLTDAGRAIQQAAVGAWDDAQRQLIDALGEKSAAQLLRKLDALTRAAAEVATPG
jgi:DNA-binding MarR family transcriptional regulator